MGSILDNHKDITDPHPWTLSCEEVMDIIRRKLANPDEFIPGQSEALFHIHLCESCSKYLKSTKKEGE